MFEVLLAYFERSFALTQDDLALIKSVFLPRKLKKDEFLQREGEVVRYAAFVEKGFLRSYVIDEKGREHIVQFAPENWWISDKNLSEGKIAIFFIDAIEDSEVLLIEKSGHESMLKKIPGYAASFRAGIQKRTAAKDKRIIDSLMSSAEQRYNDFIESYPSISQRVPQHMLASYLGITPETLSRIRKKSIGKK